MLIDSIQSIQIQDYNYDLPDDKIAKYPLVNRDSSKLLYYKNGELKSNHFFDLPILLPKNSHLVFNNTKVIQARLHFKKETGALIEIFCLEPLSPHDYNLAFSQTQTCTFTCLVGNLKKWKQGVLTTQCIINGVQVCLTADKISTQANTHAIKFSWDNSEFSFAQILDVFGELPIPPYLNRNTEQSDLKNYQTVYSKIKGSVAAPTAGLHFTDNLLNDLNDKGFTRSEICLHVGAGTFQPVKSDYIGEHKMHTEIIEVSKQSIENILNNLGNIIAVGTTSVRTLETLYYIGVRIINNNNDFFIPQWELYNKSLITVKQSLKSIVNYLEQNNLLALHASTQIIIAPGYEFKVVSGIITNFHQPKSTLLLLIAAFLGDEWKSIYQYALNHNFRFLSYGDANLFLK